MFPLKEKILAGYRFGQKTWYNNGHSGTDYKASYVNYFAPFSGTVRSGYGIQGGYWIELTRPNGDVITGRHMSKILAKGSVSEGDIIAVTGNTGAITSGPHLHLEVKTGGKLIDPENYQWGITYPIQKRVTILMNQKVWPTLLSHMASFQDWVWKNSGEKLQLIIDYKQTDFKDFPLVYTGPTIGGTNMAIIEPSWMKKNVVPFSEFTFLVIPTKQWSGGVFDQPYAEELGYAYSAYDMKTVFIIADEWTDCFPYFKSPFEGLAKIMAHEFDHLLYSLCAKDSFPKGVDRTHVHWGNKPSKPQNCWDDYQLDRLA